MKKRKDFNNIQDYIFYLINEKNLINPKNIILFIIAIGLIAFISIEFLSTNSRNEDPFIAEEFTYDYMIEVLVNQGYEESVLREMDEDRVVSLFNEVFYNTKNQNAGNEKNKEYPSSLAETLKQDYYILASKGDFKSIVTDFENKKLEYSFSELYNKDIINIYNDAYYLNTSTSQSNQYNNYLAAQILSNIKDPQMLLYGVMLSNEEARRDVIKDKISLSPILIKNNIRVDSVSSGSLESVYKSEKFKNDSRFKEVARYLNEGDYIIYRFDFTIDDNSLSAYIFKNMEDLTLGFYGMYAPSNVNDNYNYLTVMEWIELDNILSGNTGNIHQNNSNNSNNSNTNTTIQNNESTIETNDATNENINNSDTENNTNEIEEDIDESTN